MKKVKSLLLFLGLGIILPLIGKLELVFHFKIILIVIVCSIMVLSQPPIDEKEAKKHINSDQNSVWLIMILALIGMIAPITEWAYLKNNLSQSISPTSIWGLSLMVLGLSLRIWAIQLLGQFFTSTVQIQKDHKIIRRGPYKLLRHPSYTGSWLTFLGLGLWLESSWGLILASLTMFIAYYFRIMTEEETLLKTFGKSYQEYQINTYRMIPFIW